MYDETNAPILVSNPEPTLASPQDNGHSEGEQLSASCSLAAQQLSQEVMAMLGAAWDTSDMSAVKLI